jgi:transcriptional regulator with XRE-family HTH domain
LNTFGERLAYLRNQKKLTQEVLAKYFKIGKSTLGMYETNQREPGFEMTEKIADYFGVSVDWLTRGDEHKPNKYEFENEKEKHLSEAIKRLPEEKLDFLIEVIKQIEEK